MKQWGGSAQVAPLLPKAKSEAPEILKHDLGQDMTLMIGAASTLSAGRPGNGGFRIWQYESQEAAAAEVKFDLFVERLHACMLLVFATLMWCRHAPMPVYCCDVEIATSRPC